MQHTPGPWFAEKIQDCSAYNIFATGHNTALVTLEPGKYDGASPLCKPGNVDANALLIAAAPEMLAALQELLADKYLSDPINRDRMANARAAIRAATGQD